MKNEILIHFFLCTQNYSLNLRQWFQVIDFLVDKNVSMTLYISPNIISLYLIFFIMRIMKMNIECVERVEFLVVVFF